MAYTNNTSFDHVPTREEVLEALAQQGFDDLDDLAEAMVKQAQDAAESNEGGKESFVLDIWSTPWGHLIHTT